RDERLPQQRDHEGAVQRGPAPQPALQARGQGLDRRHRGGLQPLQHHELQRDQQHLRPGGVPGRPAERRPRPRDLRPLRAGAAPAPGTAGGAREFLAAAVPSPDLPRPALLDSVVARVGQPVPLLLTGPPGAGKTTLLLETARALAARGWAPIYLDLMGAASSPERFVVAALDALSAESFGA